MKFQASYSLNAGIFVLFINLLQLNLFIVLNSIERVPYSQIGCYFRLSFRLSNLHLCSQSEFDRSCLGRHTANNDSCLSCLDCLSDAAKEPLVVSRPGIWSATNVEGLCCNPQWLLLLYYYFGRCASRAARTDWLVTASGCLGLSERGTMTFL